MSEITKLYENAEVKKQIPKVCSSNELYCKECEAHIEDAMPYCKNAEYPPFTAEKQLALIKWLARKQYAKYTTSLLVNIRDTVRFSGGLIAGVCTLNVKYDKQDKDFKNALAGLINEMWQDLTEEEQQQIKEILE